MSAHDVISEHRRAGRTFAAGGTTSFALDAGDGPAVLCVHGVPVSSLLWRRVVPELAARGLRGVAVDLPGLGLAGRPPAFDYAWSGLGRWLLAALDALELDRVHLVVHDIGGPVGFELAHAAPGRVASLTILNTLVDVATFRRPWPMAPFARRGAGELWLHAMSRPAFRLLLRRTGVLDGTAVTDDELDAHLELLRRDDGGRAFLRIMRSFELDAAAERRYHAALRGPYPVQVVWGDRDPFLRLGDHGERARRAAGLDRVDTVPARHFVPLDQAPAIAGRVAAIAHAAP